MSQNVTLFILLLGYCEHLLLQPWGQNYIFKNCAYDPISALHRYAKPPTWYFFSQSFKIQRYLKCLSKLLLVLNIQVRSQILCCPRFYWRCLTSLGCLNFMYTLHPEATEKHGMCSESHVRSGAIMTARV